jgi:transposase
MGLIAKKCFPNATRVTDRFHVQKLATKALQEIRIKYPWEVIDQENDVIEKAKKSKVNFESKTLQMGYL